MTRLLLGILHLVGIAAAAPYNFCSSVTCPSSELCHGLTLPSLGGCCTVCVSVNGEGEMCSSSNLHVGQVILPNFKGICEKGFDCILGTCQKSFPVSTSSIFPQFSQSLENLAVVNDNHKREVSYLGREFPYIEGPGPVITPYLFNNHGLNNKLDNNNNLFGYVSSSGNSGPSFSYPKEKPFLEESPFHYQTHRPISIHKRSISKLMSSMDDESTQTPKTLDNQSDSTFDVISQTQSEVDNESLRRDERAPNIGSSRTFHFESFGNSPSGAQLYESSNAGTFRGPYSHGNSGSRYKSFYAQSANRGSFGQPFGISGSSESSFDLAKTGAYSQEIGSGSSAHSSSKGGDYGIQFWNPSFGQGSLGSHGQFLSSSSFKPATSEHSLSHESFGPTLYGLGGHSSTFGSHEKQDETAGYSAFGSSQSSSNEGAGSGSLSSIFSKGSFTEFLPLLNQVSSTEFDDDIDLKIIPKPLAAIILNAYSNGESLSAESLGNWAYLWRKIKNFITPTIISRLYKKYFPNGFVHSLKFTPSGQQGQVSNDNSHELNGFNKIDSLHKNFASSGSSASFDTGDINLQNSFSDNTFQGISGYEENAHKNNFISESNSVNNLKITENSESFLKENEIKEHQGLHTSNGQHDNSDISEIISNVFGQSNKDESSDNEKNIHWLTNSGAFSDPYGVGSLGPQIIKKPVENFPKNIKYNPFGFGNPGPVHIQKEISNSLNHQSSSSSLFDEHSNFGHSEIYSGQLQQSGDKQFNDRNVLKAQDVRAEQVSPQVQEMLGNPFGFGNLGPVQTQTHDSEFSKLGQFEANSKIEEHISESNAQAKSSHQSGILRNPFGFGNVGPVQTSFFDASKFGGLRNPYGYGNLGPIKFQHSSHPFVMNPSFHSLPFANHERYPLHQTNFENSNLGYLGNSHNLVSETNFPHSNRYLYNNYNLPYNPFGYGNFGPVIYPGALDSYDAASSYEPYGYRFRSKKHPRDSLCDEAYDIQGRPFRRPEDLAHDDEWIWSHNSNPTTGPLAFDFEAHRLGSQKWPDDTISLSLDTGSALSSTNELLHKLSNMFGPGPVLKNSCGPNCSLKNTLEGSMMPGPIIVAPSDTDVRIANNFYNSLEPGPMIPDHV